MSYVLIRCTQDLPIDLARLGVDARDNGYGSIDRLSVEWWDGSNRFARAGEGLLAVYKDGMLAGIGGLTIEPTDASLFRMRRFYVHSAMRRAGVGRLLVETLLESARSKTEAVTVRAGTPEASDFWVKVGFYPRMAQSYTHLHPFV
ncbi:GNAT family N-acetyltransferase [Rhizobium tumorigenes]|uniref:GNAT family N-acetyltransferase n=1 Tax=Rhizobium tumorigenes TaxID=2041385 RepID=UPI00241F38DA|nr:GNAT family N-acetyltransferase [Rhizobium tumorigenes]WFS00440.1 GNAT family N-acetyltransferase [Rhizobium tumorigenes]